MKRKSDTTLSSCEHATQGKKKQEGKKKNLNPGGFSLTEIVRKRAFYCLYFKTPPLFIEQGGSGGVVSSGNWGEASLTKKSSRSKGTQGAWEDAPLKAARLSPLKTREGKPFGVAWARARIPNREKKGGQGRNLKN